LKNKDKERFAFLKIKPYSATGISSDVVLIVK
jgi:hypothetical protein